MNWPETILIAGPIIAAGCLVVVVGYSINKKLNRLIMNITEATAALAALKITADGMATKLTNLGAAIDTQTQLVQSLQQQISNGLDAPQSFVDTLTQLQISINGAAAIANTDDAKLETAPPADGSGASGTPGDGTGTAAPGSTEGSAQ